MSIVTKNRHLEREIFVFSILFYNPRRVSRGTIFPVIYKVLPEKKSKNDRYFDLVKYWSPESEIRNSL